jgi:hypothetical protein
MKRRPVPPLFALQEPPTYVMDSSAWFNVDTLPNPDTAWAIVLALIERERLVDPSEVIEELKLDEVLWSRVQHLEGKLRFRRSDEAYLKLAGLIASEFPGMASIRSKKNKADPWVVALAEIERFTVVTDETTERRPNRKIPTACRKRGVSCVSLLKMLADEPIA